jgi:putative restriction endonuclease
VGSDEIGFIQLVSPTFFPRGAWIAQPSSWHPRIQTPVKYDFSTGEGQRVWDACLAQAAVFRGSTAAPSLPLSAEPSPRYADPRLMRPRLGQATFRIAVLDAYSRACAVTEEHSLPALEAAHIRSYANDGPHEIRNGLLLRADLHRLFDTGYVTVTPDLRLEVGRRLREHYKNGRSYYPLHGAAIHPPAATPHRPDKAFLEWHNEHVFRG